MINLFDTELAITEKINAASDYNIPFEYPGQQLNDYPNGLWGKFVNLRGEGTVATLGTNGYDQFISIIQIDVNYPENDGLQAILNKVSEIANDFQPGTRLTKNDTVLTIIDRTISPDRIVGGFRKISITARYRLRVQRDN